MSLHGIDGSMTAFINNMTAFANRQKQQKRKSDIQTIKRIIRTFKPYKIRVGVVLTAIVFTTVLGLVNPLVIRSIFDDAIGKGDLKLLVILISIMFVTPVITGIINVGQTYLNNSIGLRVIRDFRENLYTHIQAMPLRFFTSTRTGEIQSRLSNDIGGIQGAVMGTATSIVANLSTAVSTIIAMLFISPLLTLISLSLLPLFLWMTYRVGIVSNKTTKEIQECGASLTSHMQEGLSVSGVVLSKTFGRQKHGLDQFKKRNQRLTDLAIRQQMVGRWTFLFIGAFFSLTPTVVYLIGGVLIISDPLHAGITLGGIIAFTAMQSRLFFPIGGLLSLQVGVQSSLAVFDRIYEYMDMQIDIQDAPNALHLTADDIRGELAFKNVSFTYKRDEVKKDAESDQSQLSNEPVAQKTSQLSNEPVAQKTINDVSFEIEPGQLAALVGPSGAGKTTLTYFVPRLYDVDSGSVEIDGINVKDIALASLGEIIGVVTQETHLFNTSIRENLLYARADATEEEIIAAAQAAAIHDRFMELDDGYDTIVGERGYKLSGGEKQRLAIARVILKNPRILILDEATSSLDTHSERLIQAALEPLMKNRTTLAIAHRLSTILAADVILVVNKGEIVERGTHEELLQRSGLYASLYNEQFSRSREEIVV